MKKDKVTLIDPKLRLALERIVKHCQDDTFKDYLWTKKSKQAGHIYNAIALVRDRLGLPDPWQARTRPRRQAAGRTTSDQTRRRSYLYDQQRA
jgi:hypothetical protein